MFLEWLNMYLCIICLNPGRLQCHFCIHPWLWREGACEQVGQAGTIKHFDKCWYISTGDGCLRAWAMPTPGRRVRWSRADPFLLFIQTFQVTGEREISGVLRITEQTSSLTPKNRWNFGLFRFSCCELAFREDNLIWFSRDVPALAKKLRTLPILFDLDLASSQEAAQMGNPILNILTHQDVNDFVYRWSNRRPDAHFFD